MRRRIHIKMTHTINNIHPSAVIGPEVVLGAGNVIGPHVVLRGAVTIGSGNVIGAGVIIENRVVIGDRTRIGAHSCIGGPGEMGLKGDRLPEDALVQIGSDCTLREHVVIHSPVYGGLTTIGDGAYLMNHAYVAHDCTIGRRAVLSHGASLAGRCTVGDGATIGMLATIHQRLQVGIGAMVGMSAVVTRHVLPLAKVSGNPARLHGANIAVFEQMGLSDNSAQQVAAFLANPEKAEATEDDPWLSVILDFLRQHPGCLVQLRETR